VNELVGADFVFPESTPIKRRAGR